MTSHLCGMAPTSPPVVPSPLLERNRANCDPDHRHRLNLATINAYLSDIGLGDQLDSRVFDKESIAVTKFRIRITDHVGKVSYLVRRAGNIDINYISADEVP